METSRNKAQRRPKIRWEDDVGRINYLKEILRIAEYIL